MAVEIGALRALLSLDSAAFERGARRAEASMSGLQRSLSRTAARFKAFGKTMSARVTAPVVAATTGLVTSSLRAVDAQAKFAQSLGTTTESIQVLTRAADMAGISQSDLEGSLRRMTRRLSLAESGAGAGAKAFERLGLSAADMADLDAADRIKLIQERISEFVPEAERAAVASQIFGDRTGLAMLRLDAGTIEAAAEQIDRFGVSVADVDADKIEAANDAVSALGLVARGLGNQLAVALAPTIQSIAEKIADLGAWFADLSPQMQRFTGIAVSVAAAVGPMAVALGFVAAGLAAIASPVGLVILGLGAVAGAAAWVAANWTSLTEKYPGLQTAFDVVRDTAVRLGEAISGRFKLAWDNAKATLEIIRDLLNGDFSGALEGAKQIVQNWVTYLEGAFPGVMSTIRETIKAGVAAGRDIVNGVIDGITQVANDLGAAVLGLWRNIVASLRAIPGLIAEDAKQIGKDIVAGIAEGIGVASPTVGSASRKAARDALDATRKETDTRSPSREFMKIGRDLMAGLSIGIADSAQGSAQQAAQAAQQVIASADETMQIGAQKITSTFDQIGDAVAGAITQGRDLGSAMRQVFRQIASDFISSGISNLLSNLFGSGGGSSGGSFLSALFGGFRADGGPVSAGKAYVVGERGPEMFVPRGAGNIVPNEAMRGGGTTTVQVVLSPDLEARIMQQAAGQTVQIVGAAQQEARRAVPSRVQSANQRGT